MPSLRGGLATLGFGIWACGTSAEPGMIIVNGDEWALSNPGFFNAPPGSVRRFVENLVDEIGPRIHAYSTNFGYTQSNLAQAMAGAGADYNWGMNFEFTLENILNYDAIMLGGKFVESMNADVLHQYIEQGGHLYVSAGTGVARPYTEEGRIWSAFLAGYGIKLETEFSRYFGNVTTEGDRIFDGVEELYVGNPNAVTMGGMCCRENSVFAIWRPVTGEDEPAGSATEAPAAQGASSATME